MQTIMALHSEGRLATNRRALQGFIFILRCVDYGVDDRHSHHFCSVRNVLVTVNRFVRFIVSFSRLCRCPLLLEGIDSVLFRGPSYVGERVFIQTSVNRVFTNKRYTSYQVSKKYRTTCLRGFISLFSNLFFRVI